MFLKILDCKSTHKINTDKFFLNDFVDFLFVVFQQVTKAMLISVRLSRLFCSKCTRRSPPFANCRGHNGLNRHNKD